MTAKIETGKWVLCWGQVQDDTQHHPDDTVVRMESHSEDYPCHVRIDRIVIPTDIPAFAPKCNALTVGASLGVYLRCELHHGHAGMHQGNGALLFPETQVRGYIEDV